MLDALSCPEEYVLHAKFLLSQWYIFVQNSSEILSFENQPADALNEATPRKVSVTSYDIRNEGGKPTAYYELTTIAGDGR